MTEFFLDNQRIFLPESSIIKIKSENVYFTKSGKYSLDVEIPLVGNHNNAIVFKHIHRKEVKKETRTFKARLIAGNIVILDGIATITGITEKSVKVQLLAGNAELNFSSKNSSLYIDEMDLGKIEYDAKFSGWVESMGVIFEAAGIENEKERYKKLFGLYGETDVVCFPVYNETEDKVYNEMCVRVTGKDTTTVFLAHYNYATTTHADASLKFLPAKSECAPQPYFCYVIRQVFAALGYDIAENQIEKTKLKNLFISNSKPTLLIKEMMPHWTVNEFQTQVEDFFGVIITIDDATKSVRILLRNEHFGTEETYIDQVNDEYSVTCEEDETTDISNGNIGYSFGDVDPYLKIDNDIVEKVEGKSFATYSELKTYYDSLSEAEKAKYIYSASGKQYIHYEESTTNKYLREVNQFRDLIRNDSKDLDVELKIVPVRMEVSRIKWEGVKYESFFQRYYPTEGQTLNGVMMHVTGGEETAETDFKIQDAIDGDMTTESTKSIIEVAMNDGLMQKVTTDDGKSSHVFPWPFVLTLDPLQGEKNRGFSFELNQVEGRETMFNTVFGLVMKINTQSEIVFKFLSNKMHNVMHRFIINNKSYVCKMIEYPIDHEGIQEEKTGYFYEYLDK